MSDITLSAAVRQNLLTLQSTADLLSDVQGKLATGLKVNSALDNPNSFFTASGLNSRANDLNNLLDDMGQSLQTLKAADKGIQSITDLVDSAKAKANQALQTQSQFERAQFAKQYNDLLEQIEDLAKDSSYKGKNLLAGGTNDLTTIFNEDATSKQTISAVDYTDSSLSGGLNLNDIAEAEGGVSSFDLAAATGSFTLEIGSGQPLNAASLLSAASAVAVGSTITVFNGSGASVGTALAVTAGTTVRDLVNYLDGFEGVRAEFDDATGQLTVNSNDGFRLRELNGAASADLIAATSATAFTNPSDTLVRAGSFKVGDTLTLTDGNQFELGSLEIDENTTVDDLTNFINDFNGVSADFNTTSGRITINSETNLTLASNNSDFNDVLAAAPATPAAGNDGTVGVTALTQSGFATDTQINRVIDRLNTALSNLRSQASEFGTNLSTIEIRQDYTRSLINTLQEGAGLLTLADTNEEGANLLALQTRQQLASTSLSFASQADQTVLSLF